MCVLALLCTGLVESYRFTASVDAATSLPHGSEKHQHHQGLPTTASSHPHGHSHGHGHVSMKMPMPMPMTFHFSTTGEVLFTWWNMTGAASLVLSCVVVLAMSLIKVACQRARQHIMRKHRRAGVLPSGQEMQSLLGERGQGRKAPPVVLPAILLLLSTTLGGLLMLGAYC